MSLANDKLKILIVDDDRVDRMICSRILKKSNVFSCEITEADSGKQALELISKGKFDGIILDYKMPDMNGMELIASLRENRNIEMPVVIVLIEHGSEIAAANAIKEGVSDYIIKSQLQNDPQLLIKSVLFSIHTRRLENNLYLQNEEFKKERIRIIQSKELADALVKQAQEAVVESNKFFASMSHELRSPLSCIIEFAQLMFSDKTGSISEQYKECSGEILASSRHLLQLIDNILDLIKGESGVMKYYPELIDINKITYEVANILSTLISSKEIGFNVSIDSNLGPIYIDPVKFKQIIYNYLSNAIKFTRPHGKITMSIRSMDMDRFIFEVEDTGVGIPQEDLNRLFVEYTQLGSDNASKSHGTGLGLAITKQIVEAQGGHVGVTSEFGKGSKFYAIIPKIHRQMRYAEEKLLASMTAHKPYRAAPRVLIIESDRKDSAFIATILSNEGYLVERVFSGTGALHFVNEYSYDAILIGLLLPDMSGVDLIRELRSQGSNRDIPIIVISMMKEIEISNDLDVNAILYKPILTPQLLSSLKQSGIVPRDTKTILIANTDEKLLLFCKKNLNQLGYQAYYPSNGENALQVADDKHLDLVIMDMTIPGMDGFEFLHRLREKEACKKTPVIIYTAKQLSERELEKLYSSSCILLKNKDGGISKLVAELLCYFPSSISKGDAARSSLYSDALL